MSWDVRLVDDKVCHFASRHHAQISLSSASLRATQLYPDDYDGVLAGAPAWNTIGLENYEVLTGSYNLPVNVSHFAADANLLLTFSGLPPHPLTAFTAYVRRNHCTMRFSG